MARTTMGEFLNERVDLIEQQFCCAVKDANGRAYNRTAHLPATTANAAHLAKSIAQHKAGKAARRDPFAGIGKPESLLGNLAGCWSRRIDETHRLVYAADDVGLDLIACHGHCDDWFRQMNPAAKGQAMGGQALKSIETHRLSAATTSCSCQGY